MKYGSKLDQVEKMLLEAKKRSTEALYLTTNTITVLTMTAIKNLNLKVPEDIAFVGFDYSPVFDVYDTTVSYIRQSTEQLAYESFSMLVNMIEQEADASTVVLKPELVQRGSSKKI